MNNYSVLLKHPKWFEKRKIVFERDGYNCKFCGSDKNLQIHHRQYHYRIQTGEFVLPWCYKLKYLVTLCNYCHQRGHSIFKVKTFKF